MWEGKPDLRGLRDPSQRKETLFRYRSLERIDYLRAIMLDHQLYAPLVGSGGFNDPCELFYSVEFTWDEEYARAMVRHLRSHPQPKISNDIVRSAILGAGRINSSEFNQAMEALNLLSDDAIVERLLAGGRNMPEDLQESFKAAQRKIDEKTVGVCSMTERGDSPFMSWYYGDQHQGVCLEFSTEFGPFDRAVPVEYQSDPPIYKTSDPPYLQQVARMQTKGLAWKEEAEWRLFSHPSTGLALKFKPEALVSVCLGSLISPAKEAAVLDIIAERNFREKPIRVYRFQHNRSQYIFNRVPVDPELYSVAARERRGKARDEKVRKASLRRIFITSLGIIAIIAVSKVVAHFFPGLEVVTFGALLMLLMARALQKGREESKAASGE
jgi:hypothetical protein